MAPEKVAPEENGTWKKWRYVNLEKMAPVIAYLDLVTGSR